MASLIRLDSADTASSIGGLPIAPTTTAWPTCKQCSSAMQFIAQIPLSASDNPALADRPQTLLIFQCQAEPGMCDDWDAESGGNCAVLVPSDAVQTLAAPAGSTTLDARTPVKFEPYDDSVEQNTPDDNYCDTIDEHWETAFGKIGGVPLWMQGDETPSCICGQKMAFFAQLEAHGGGGINFGDSGAGYAFVCTGCLDTAKFLWQCG